MIYWTKKNGYAHDRKVSTWCSLSEERWIWPTDEFAISGRRWVIQAKIGQRNQQTCKFTFTALLKLGLSEDAAKRVISDSSFPLKFFCMYAIYIYIPHLVGTTKSNIGWLYRHSLPCTRMYPPFVPSYGWCYTHKSFEQRSKCSKCSVVPRNKSGWLWTDFPACGLFVFPHDIKDISPHIDQKNIHQPSYISYPLSLMLKSPMKNHMCHHQRSQVSSQVSRGPRCPRCWMYSWLPTTYVLETWREWRRPLKWHTYVGWVYKPQWCEFVGLDSPQGSQRAAREIYGKSMELCENYKPIENITPHFHFTFVREISTTNHSIQPLFLGQPWKWPVAVI